MRMKRGQTGAQSSITETKQTARWILLGDLAWTILAFGIASVLRYGLHWSTESARATLALLPFLVGSCFLWIVLFYRFKLDGFHGGWWLPSVTSGLLLAVACEMILLLAAAYLTRQYVSRLALSYLAIFLFPGLLMVRQLARRALRGKHIKGQVCKVVIAGSDNVAREIASKLSHHPEMLCQIVGFLFPEDRVDNSFLTVESHAAARDVSTLEVTDLLDLHDVDELIVALPQPATTELIRLATQCQQRGIGVSLVPQPYDLYLSRPKLLDLDGLPILKLCEPSVSQLFLSAKRAIDILLGGVFLALSSIIVLPSAFVLFLLRGRAFQWEIRCGKDFTQFRMLRLNVRRDAIHETRFEHMLELFSVTELPQLWNVLLGDMSLVGPRPEPPSRTRRYTSWEEHRLSVRPGITGLAQVRGLREHHSSEAKARLDLQYLLNPSLATDLSILLQTAFTLATRRRRAAANVIEMRNDNPIHRSATQPTIEEVKSRADRAQSRAN